MRSCASVSGFEKSSERVADTRVDTQRHVQVQAVIDHRRDQWAVALHLGLALDQRGHREQFVGRNAKRVRATDLDSAEVFAEANSCSSTRCLTARPL